MLIYVNLRPGGALRWKVEDHRLRRSVSDMWQADTSKVVAPHVCRLRTDGLAPTSKYWTYRSHTGDMGLVSLVIYCQQVLGLSALLQWLCWERNWGGSYTTTQSGWEVESGALFLRSSAYVQPCWWLTKGCYTRTTWDTYGLGPYVDWAWDACDMLIGFSLQGVHWFESPRLLDMSNCLFAVVSK
jgi:hypothetical protein